MTHLYDDSGNAEIVIAGMIRTAAGGEEGFEEVLDLPQPQAPVINDLNVHVGDGGRVEISLAANDPDGTPVRAHVHWGDEDDPSDQDHHAFDQFEGWLASVANFFLNSP